MITKLLSLFKPKTKKTYRFSCAPEIELSEREAADIIEGATYINSIKYAMRPDAGRFEFIGHEHSGRDKPIIYVLQHMRTGIEIRVEADLFAAIFQPSK